MCINILSEELLTFLSQDCGQQVCTIVLPKKVFISPSVLKDNFSKYIFLYGDFILPTLNISLQSLMLKYF